MRRREFIAGLGSVTTWPLAARAQQSAACRGEATAKHLSEPRVFAVVGLRELRTAERAGEGTIFVLVCHGPPC
jgi:hypothetical protein